MDHLEVDVFKKERIEDVITELQAAKVPCVIRIYDRVLQFDTKEELRMFVYGLEVGNYVALDKKEGIK
jgi:hypothetical protein